MTREEIVLTKQNIRNLNKLLKDVKYYAEYEYYINLDTKIRWEMTRYKLEISLIYDGFAYVTSASIEDTLSAWDEILEKRKE